LAPVIPITDPGDPRIAAFREVRDRDIAGRDGGFIAEGEVVLRVLARGGPHRTRALLIARSRLARLEPLIAAFGEAVAVYAASQGVMDAIAGFPIHRGILAHGLRAAPAPASDLLSTVVAAPSAPGPIILVLFGIANHDNMGGLFRNAAAFGVHAVFLDPTSCDPLYRKAIRVSVGAALSVPFARLAPGEDVIALLRAFGFTPLALSPAGATALTALARPPRAAVMFGAEGPGLPPSILSRAETVAIPMAGVFDSLNVATTSGIVLHHLAFARSLVPPAADGL
jgi:tRNA G18 (ribose-2'-O)-methylase SpoU